MTKRVRLLGKLRVSTAGFTVAALSLATGVAWTAVSPGRTAGASGVAPILIQMKNFAFDPPAIAVSVGQTLTWTNNDVVPHTATADEKFWDSGQMAPGLTYTVTVTKPGTYDYRCSIHPFMHAKVIVTK